MNVAPKNPSAVSFPPPQLIQSLVGGFNAVANNIHLILLPVLFDILFWFGPHIRVKVLMEPTMIDVVRFMRQNGTVEMQTMLDQFEQVWKIYLSRYNLLSTLSTFPVGIPSLMSERLPVRTPLGQPVLFEVNSYGQFLLAWIGLTLAGYVLGSLYFALIAQVCQ